MKILDCTLRDGGHSVGFDWPMEMAKEYYGLMQEMGVDTIELGYWKQTNKYTTPFFNLDIDKVREVVDGRSNRDISIMVDYHYCLKDLNEYPTYDDQDMIKMIRICSRKQDLKNALVWADMLKEHTGLEVSINVFNISNYEPEELESACGMIMEHNTDYVYFADTHGSLDLHAEDYDKLFKTSVEILSGKKVGFHFHNHTGKEYSNFLTIFDKAYISDTTVHGIGKGAGNLKLEHVILDNGLRLKLVQFIDKYQDILKKEFSPYFFVTGSLSVCEAYASQAQSMEMPLDKFIAFCESLDLKSKDVYRKDILEEYTS